MAARFSEIEVGARLSWSDIDGLPMPPLLVISKAESRIEMQAENMRTLSLYAQEFDARSFEVIPEIKAAPYRGRRPCAQFPTTK